MCSSSKFEKKKRSNSQCNLNISMHYFYRNRNNINSFIAINFTTIYKRNIFYFNATKYQRKYKYNCCVSILFYLRNAFDTGMNTECFTNNILDNIYSVKPWLPLILSKLKNSLFNCAFILFFKI